MSIRDSLFAYKLAMGVIHAYEWFVYYLMLSLYKPCKLYIHHRFKSNGIQIDVEEKKMQPGDMKIYNQNFYARLCAYRTMGLGESYVDGWWDTTSVEELFYKIFYNNLYLDLFNKFHRSLNFVEFNLFNLQTQTRSWEVGEKHYDQGNELFKSMLDDTMNYSCGYWKEAKDLNEAQQNKMKLIAAKLQLKPGMKVLDIGCGWGALCKYLAENHKVQMVGCTISVEGAKVGNERCSGLPVDIRVSDYRDINEKFDRIVSVGMFEHVGHSNYRTFFEVANRCLTDDGILLLHTIGVNHPNIPLIEPWFNTYIFPNGILPYQSHIGKYSDGLFILEDWQNIGHHYYKTLKAWLENFNTSWPLLRQNYKDPERFYRMWTYYLQVSAAAFRSRKYQCWQVVLSKNGIPGGYDSPR